MIIDENRQPLEATQLSLLEEALKYVAKGWPVVPLYSVRDGACDCGNTGCPSPDKHPRTANGLKDATTDARQIRQWWTRWPEANIGVVTGSRSRIVVIDLDINKGGLDSWANLMAAQALVETLTVITGSGGQHLIFQAPMEVKLKSTAGQLAPGVDTRAEGGYVVAPPSLHFSGRRYHWANALDPAPLPAWLLALWPKTANVLENRSAPFPRETIPEGQRNTTLASLAGTMRRREMGQEAIEAALLSENATRCVPPLPEAEVLAIARSIASYPPGRLYGHCPGGASPPPVTQATSQWPEPLAEEAFYGLAGEMVRAVEPHTEADPAAILLNLLTCSGNAMGRSPHAVAESDRHGANVCAVLVGETAKARKGSSFGHIRELFQRVDPVWSGRILGGLSSGEGLVWHVRDPVEKLEAVKKNGKATGEHQTVVVDEGVTDKRLLCYEPELASVLKVLSREGNTLSPLIRQAWDTGTLRTMTKNNPAVATDAHISILGHITKEELLRYLNDTEAANGFANRFLWACVRRSKVLPEGGGRVEFHHLVQALHQALEQARTLGRLDRAPEAKEAWAEIYPELSQGQPGLFGAATARAEAQVLRLSVVYAALDGADAMHLPHLMAALAVWEYCEASARYIFGDATGDPVADRILQSLRSGDLPRTGISALFQRNVPAGRIDQDLNLLASTRRATLYRQETEGRPIEVWRAS